MIQKDALELLIKTAKDSLTPIPVTPATTEKQATFLIDGRPVVIPIPIPSKTFAVDTLEAFAALVNRECEGKEQNAVVFFDKSDVIGVLDESNHRVDCVRLQLPIANAIAQISDPKNAARKTHKEMIKYLRLQLADVIGAKDLLDKIRDVQFRNDGETNSSQARGRESISASLKREVKTSQVESIPETAIFAVAAWDSPRVRKAFDVRMLVEIDPDDQTFQLFPAPDEIGRFYEAALAYLETSLRGQLHPQIGVFQGRPE